MSDKCGHCGLSHQGSKVSRLYSFVVVKIDVRNTSIDGVFGIFVDKGPAEEARDCINRFLERPYKAAVLDINELNRDIHLVRDILMGVK